MAELPGSKREVTEIQRLAGQRQVVTLSAAEASTSRVMDALPRARYVHLATHGFFAEQKFLSYMRVADDLFQPDRGLKSIGSRSTLVGRNPLILSGLVFAGANTNRQRDEHGIAQDDGGILTAEGIAALPLYELKLAVLSACETGLGDVAGGEGVYGLQRAFHIAGARNVIASLWKVDDDATAALMRLFYHQLWNENKPPLEALRHSQLAIYHYPDQVRSLATTRGLLLVDKNSRNGASGKSPTSAWAAFMLSGSGQ